MTSQQQLEREVGIREIRGLLLRNLQMLVNDLEKIVIEAIDRGPDDHVSLIIGVSENDVGRVIGAQGKTLAALRTIVVCAATRLHLRTRLELRNGPGSHGRIWLVGKPS